MNNINMKPIYIKKRVGDRGHPPKQTNRLD